MFGLTKAVGIMEVAVDINTGEATIHVTDERTGAVSTMLSLQSVFDSSAGRGAFATPAAATGWDVTVISVSDHAWSVVGELPSATLRVKRTLTLEPNESFRG